MDASESKIALANYAATKFGGKSFNFGDGSSSDKVITPIYDKCLKFLLEECPWSFATKTVALQQLSVTPINFGDNLTIAYALPPDFLKPYLINFSAAATRFENINGQLCLLSDTAGLIIKYVFLNDDPTTYSQKFYEALACKIAKEACFKLVEAQQYVQQLNVDYERAFLTAAASDGQMSSPDQIQQFEWESSRLAGNNFVYYPNQQIGFYPWVP